MNILNGTQENQEPRRIAAIIGPQRVTHEREGDMGRFRGVARNRVGAGRIETHPRRCAELVCDDANLLALACKMSVAIGGVTALQNFTELFTKMDQKYPELRA